MVSHPEHEIPRGNEESGVLFNAQLQRVLAAEDLSAEHLAQVLTLVRSAPLGAFLEQQRNVNALQADRLRSVFDLIGNAPEEGESAGMNGLMKEGMALAEEFDGPEVVDQAVLIGTRAMVHHQISGYKDLIALSGQLPERARIGELLQECYQDEVAALEELDRMMRKFTSIGDDAEKDRIPTEEEGR